MPSWNVNFQTVLDRLSPDAVIEISNELPQNNTIFDQLLPDRLVASYQAEAGNMIVTPTMAGLSAMDAPYNPVGAAEASDFSERIAKISSTAYYSERDLRMLQQKAAQMTLSGLSTTELVERTIFNFANGVVIQAHRDTSTWLKAQAIVHGEIDWLFNGLRLNVDYGIPSENVLPTRTGNDAYHGTASKFWADVLQARRLLNYRLRTIIAHEQTIDAIVSNDANKLDILQQSDDGKSFTIRRYRGSLERPETDARYTISLTATNDEGVILNPNVPGQTIKVPFMPFGHLIFVGSPGPRIVSVDEPYGDLGYNHLGPTAERGGTPGRWARVYTPEAKQYQLVGEAVSNLLPVIENPTLIVKAQTEMPS